MPTIKLTKYAVERIDAPTPSGKQVLFWDAELRGFGVLVSGKSTAKTYVAQRRLPDGTLRRVTIGAVGEFQRVEDARRKAGDILTGLRAGTDPKLERRKAADRDKTLQFWLNEYLTKRTNLRERSVSGYRGSIERYLADWLNQPLREVTPEMIETKHAEIGKHHGGATANVVMRVFRAVHNFARDRDTTLPENPVRRLKKGWFEVARRTSMVRSDELPAFYKAVDSLPSRTAKDYLKLLLFTGLRRSEAASLRWNDIDLTLKVIRLPAMVTKSKQKLDLPMTSFVRDLLVARRAIGREGDWVFPADSRSGHIAEPKFPLKLVAQATGIEVTAHDLRRTYVTVAESADISPLSLKALVNHALGTDVTSGYVTTSTERLREPAQRVCDKLIALCQIEVPAAVPLHG